jgi:hypothetical protein
MIVLHEGCIHAVSCESIRASFGKEAARIAYDL